jgi:hypothetical protein
MSRGIAGNRDPTALASSKPLRMSAQISILKPSLFDADNASARTVLARACPEMARNGKKEYAI